MTKDIIKSEILYQIKNQRNPDADDACSFGHKRIPKIKTISHDCHYDYHFVSFNKIDFSLIMANLWNENKAKTTAEKTWLSFSSTKNELFDFSTKKGKNFIDFFIIESYIFTIF